MFGKEYLKFTALRSLMVDLGGIALLYGENEDVKHGAVSAYVLVVMAIDILRENDITDTEALADLANLDADVNKVKVIDEMKASAAVTKWLDEVYDKEADNG